MKKLVLLLMLIGALRSFGAVATNVQNLSQFGTTNRAMASDGIGLSTRYATGSERLMGIQVTNLIRSLNALGIGTNTTLLVGGTNVVIDVTRTGSNVTYTISVGTNNATGSSMTNALLHAGPTNGSVGALVLTAGTNILLATDGTNRVINTLNNVSLVDVTNIVNNATNGLGVSPPLSSVQYNSNSVQSGSSGFVFTNGLVGIGTNAPPYLLSLFNSSISDPSVDIAYAAGAGNTTAIRLRNGAGATNFTVGVDGLVKSETINNSVTITSATVTATALNVTGGTLGAGKVLTDTGGTGAATWQTPSTTGTLTPGVTNVASASTIIIDLAATNTPVVVLTNAPAHVTTLVVSNPAPGRWFSFYADGNGGITNNAIGWGGVDGLLLKWLDASTNSIIVSNGFVSVSGYIAQTASKTNLVITHRHE